MINEIVYNGSKFELIPKHAYYIAKFDVPTSNLEMWKNTIYDIFNSKLVAEDEQIISIPNKWGEELEDAVYIPSNDGNSYTIHFFGSFHSCWKLFKEFQAFKNHDFYINAVLEGLKLRNESTEDLKDKDSEEYFDLWRENFVLPSPDWEEIYLIYLESTNQKLNFEEDEEDEEEAIISAIDEFIRSDDFNDFGYNHVSYEECMLDYD